MPHVSQRWVLWVPIVDEVAEVLLSILNRNDISTCCLVGHSYGSAVASRLLQQAPQRIQQLCLIDPICFAMHMPTLLRNFMYEWPGSGSWLGDFMMISAARDLHVSATLSRRFFWSGEPGTAWRGAHSSSNSGSTSKPPTVQAQFVMCGVVSSFGGGDGGGGLLTQQSLHVLCWCPADVNLWEEQIPPDTLVVLSGRDALMAAPQVR
jgi:pimeloyl-ACP methyl ester carboxylesterase